MKKKILTLLSLIIVSSFLNLQAQGEDFDFGERTIKPGTRKSFFVEISSEKDSLKIPISIFHGKKPGPVLGITAGVHGMEYVPIIAAQNFAKKLDPNQMRGTVILVHIANLPSFLNRSVRINPQDDKNLNRVFPGNKNGSITQRLAYFLSNNVIAKSDYFLDMHAGDANNELRPYSGYYNYSSSPEISQKARDMARALGFPFIVQFGNTDKVEGASKYCSREAFVRGIPAVDIECGQKALVEEDAVAQIEDALESLLNHLEISVGKSKTIPEDKAVFIAKRTTVTSNHEGFFYSNMSSGDYVQKGMKLGYTTDLFGNRQETIYAPVEGFILYKSFNPPIKKGDGLFNIGHLPKKLIKKN